MEAPIKILRDCDSTLIPSGDQIKLIKGTLVRVTQALGGDYTLYVNGNLVKISGRDADAIGKEVQEDLEKNIINNGEYSEELVWEQLKTCYDPEIPVNIVDLGLIYDLSKEGSDQKGYTINIKMTLTAQGCGMGPVIADDAKQRILALPEVESAQVDIVWDPPWNPRMISEEGKKILGLE